jgi:type III secretion system FlhB-like substrate exporter
MTPVGFEPTQLALVELESTPLDHSGKASLSLEWHRYSCPTLFVHGVGLWAKSCIDATTKHPIRIASNSL